MNERLHAEERSPQPYMNPYLAGLMLGTVLLASFLILGVGLGASAGIARIGAALQASAMPEHVQQSAYFGAWGTEPLQYYLVFMFAGTVLGGLVSAVFAGRVAPQLERGENSSFKLRALTALGGGILVGFASRLASGCTSGQALTGGAMLLSGSLLFLIAVFAGGYAAAYFVRGQWK